MDAVVLPVRRDPVGVTRIKERLRRNAADGHADPADAISLDERNLGALDRGVECSDVPAGAATENRDVVRGH